MAISKKDICPHPECESLIEFIFDSDYYMKEEGTIFERFKCPICARLIALSHQRVSEIALHRGDEV